MNQKEEKNWEDAPDASITRELNTWRRSFADASLAAASLVHVGGVVSGSSSSAPSHELYAQTARAHNQQHMGQLVKHWPHQPANASATSSASVGVGVPSLSVVAPLHSLPELLGPTGVLFPPSTAAKSKSRSTQTEKWGDYSQAVARIQSLGEQIQHLYNINNELDENLQCSQRIIQEMSREKQMSSQKQIESEKEYMHMKDTYGKQIERIQDLLDDNTELKETVHDQQITLNHNAQHMASQTNVINKLIEEKAHLNKLIAELKEEIAAKSTSIADLQSQLAKSQSLLETSNHQLSSTHALLQLSNTRLSAQKSELEDARASIASSQRILDEHIRQNQLDKQHSDTKMKQVEEKLKVSEQENVSLQSDVRRLKEIEVAYIRLEEEVNPAAEHARLTLSRAQEHINHVESRNAQLSALVVAREKIISDMITSDAYKDELREKRKQEAKQQELAAKQQQQLYAKQKKTEQQQLRGADQSSTCVLQ